MAPYLETELETVSGQIDHFKDLRRMERGREWGKKGGKEG